MQASSLVLSSKETVYADITSAARGKDARRLRTKASMGKKAKRSSLSVKLGDWKEGD